MGRTYLFLIWASILASLASYVAGQTDDRSGARTPGTLDGAALFRASCPSMVQISTKDAKFDPLRSGSGFVISSDGAVVTNYHVIDGASIISVRHSNGGIFRVRGIRVASASDDIAVLQLEARDLPALKLSDARAATGTSVFALGHPAGLENTFSEGIISGMRTDPDGRKLIQTTAAISPGSSGGPLLLPTGEVIGVTTAFLESGQNLNFCVPIERVVALLGEQTERPIAEFLRPFDLQEQPASVAKQDTTSRFIDRAAAGEPFEVSIGFSVSADESVRPILESYFRNDLRALAGVVLSNETPDYQVDVVAIPDRLGGDRIARVWMSIVLFEYHSHFDPTHPETGVTQGVIVRQRLVAFGVDVLKRGISEEVAKLDSEVLEPRRTEFEAIKGILKKTEGRESKPTK